jgi:hypothetical protein
MPFIDALAGHVRFFLNAVAGYGPVIRWKATRYSCQIRLAFP